MHVISAGISPQGFRKVPAREKHRAHPRPKKAFRQTSSSVAPVASRSWTCALGVGSRKVPAIFPQARPQGIIN
eukprot:2492314-Heterocapsa_arctica.AAC.1